MTAIEIPKWVLIVQSKIPQMPKEYAIKSISYTYTIYENALIDYVLNIDPILVKTISIVSN